MPQDSQRSIELIPEEYRLPRLRSLSTLRDTLLLKLPVGKLKSNQ